MVTYLFASILLIAVAVNGRNDRPIRSLWDKVAEKIKDKTIHRLDLDNRHFSKEEMLLFADVAFPSVEDSNKWKVVVHGWRYQGKERSVWAEITTGQWIERLARNIVNPDDLRYLNGSVNRDRLRPFFVSDRANEAITIKLGNSTHTVHTDQHGEFYEEIDATNSEIQKLKQQGNVIRYEGIGDDGDKFTGVAHLIEPSQGLSVISDIDDTIKISEVLDKVRLLANTFILPFKAVPGMADLYQQWHAKNSQCTFHYLSGMPDQLYTLTQEFIRDNRFPDGSFHMRHFGWAVASLFNFLHSESTFTHKMSYLRFFFSHTLRDFVLIGDSGEKDPEIYGTIAREYPARVRAIFIRAIKNETFDDQRFSAAFEGVPQEKWLIVMIFTCRLIISLSASCTV